MTLIGGMIAAAPLAAQQPVPVPSGQQVVLQEVLSDDTPGALWLRFRFVAPQLGAVGQEASAADMDHLCSAVALPYLAEAGIEAERLVISLSEKPLPFGEAAPGVPQYFEIYRSGDSGCIWEGF